MTDVSSPRQFDDLPTVTFDRAGNRLTTRDLKARLAVALLRGAERATAPWNHVGISRLHGLIGKLFAPGNVTDIGLASGGTFSYPSNDYYWNRLLTLDWDYERDIQAILHAMRDVRYTFVDIGANFGFFSCLAGSPAFGAQRLVAVEPARMAYELLERNLAPFADHAQNYRLAIDNVSGNAVTLFGERHAGFTLKQARDAESTRAGEVVHTISIDDVLARSGVDAASAPVLVKLEVEGIEMRALEGAQRTIAGDAAFIIEEIEPTGISDCIQYAFDTLGMTMFYSENDQFRELSGMDELKSHRVTQQGLQARGTSIVAFRNGPWRERLKGLFDA